MRPLADIGTSEKPLELSLEGTGRSFVMCWICLSLIVIRNFLELYAGRWTRDKATEGMEFLAKEDDTGNNDALAGARKIDKTLRKAMDYLEELYDDLCYTEDLTEEAEGILRNHDYLVSELERIDKEADSLTDVVDSEIYRLQDNFKLKFGQIISQFPCILDDFDRYANSQPFGRLVELYRDTRKTQFIRPRVSLKSMCSPAATLRNILEGKGDRDKYKELLKNLKDLPFGSRSGLYGNVVQRQLWQMQDLHNGGGLGFTVGLFFLALDQLLSTSSSSNSYSTLYMGAFRTITSDWNKYKHLLGTQNLLLYIAWSRFEEFSDRYPACIVDEFLKLLGNVFEGQTRSRIGEAVRQFTSLHGLNNVPFWDRVLAVIGAQPR